MKKRASERAREGTYDKVDGVVCSQCGGTGRDLSKSLWGEFICLACGGTGKSVRSKRRKLTVDKTG